MSACSENYPQRCYAVSYDPSQGDCYLKGNNSDTANLSKSDKWNSAFADANQLKTPANTSCPVANNENLKTDTGMSFSILCGQDFGAAGEYCSGFSSPCVYHTDSLQKCLDYCAAARPLCKGVSWNANMGAGYPNCYLKKSPDAAKATTPSDIVMHSAKLVDDALSKIDISVPTSLNYTTSNGALFNITQYDSRSGASNFTSLHADSVGQCMDNCSLSKSQCAGILFDNVITNGFSNCYLLNNTGAANKGANVTFAQLSNVSTASSNTTAQSDDGHPANKAWIAGPVMAVVAVIAIVAAIMVWQRRRRERAVNRLSSYGMLLNREEEAVEEDGTHPFAPVEVNCESYVPEMTMSSVPHELPSPDEACVARR